MRLWSQQSLQALPVEQDFRLRGMEMTRIEVFVDAAFAFAVTLLVISFDAIPSNFAEIVSALKRVPAFVLAVIQLVWIWYEHSLWSKRFGLENSVAVALSTALVIVVLVYIYPLRILMEGLFGWITAGYLPTDFRLDSYEQLAQMFVILGVGFVAFCTIFIALYGYVLRRAEVLGLDALERYHTRRLMLLWSTHAFISVVAIGLALTVPPKTVPFTGFTYVALWASGWVAVAFMRGPKPERVASP